MKKIILSILTFLLASFLVVGQTTMTIKGGVWSDPTIWTNGVPRWGMNAIVNHKLLLDKDVSLGSGDIIISSSGGLRQWGGNYNISVWDPSGRFINYGVVEINNLSGNGFFYNEGVINAVKITISSNGTDLEFVSKGEISLSGDMVFNSDVNVELEGKVSAQGDLQLGTNATLLNNADFSLQGKTSINDGAVFTNNKNFLSDGDIWAGKATIVNNAIFSARTLSAEAQIINKGSMKLYEINNLYQNAKLFNDSAATINVENKILFYDNSILINKGEFNVNPALDNSAISGLKFENYGNFNINDQKVDLSCDTTINYGNITVHDVAGDTYFDNYKNFTATGNVDRFSGSNEFYNHKYAEMRVLGYLILWAKNFVNEGFVYVEGNVRFGSGMSILNNKNVFVTKGEVLNQTKFFNNGAFYCIGNGDFNNDWGSKTLAHTCGHVNVGCNNFNDYGYVENMNIHGNYIKLGGDPPLNLSHHPYLPCDSIDIYYYSRADGKWEDYNACSDICVWSLKQIWPDPIYEYPRFYGKVTIDNNLITITENTTPQPLSCDSLALKPLGKLTIENNKSLTVNGNFIINSPENSGATGSLIDYGDLIVNGSKTVQRFITGFNWHYIGFPTDSVLRSDFNRTNFYYYDETTNDTWNGDNIYGEMGWKNPADGFLNTPMKGYIYYYYDDMLEFHGDLYTGEQSITLSYTNNNPDHPEFDGWNLVANPYPSAVNWDLVNTDGIADNCIYYYDDDGSPPYYNNYRYYIKGGGGDSPYPGIAVNGGQPYIPVAQAFFVRTTTDGTVLTFDNSVRVHSDQDFYKKQTKKHPNLIRLQISDKNAVDETVIRFIPEATKEFDGKFDAIKFFTYNSGLPQIYSITETGSNLAINTLPNYENVSVPLGFKVSQNGYYFIEFTEFNFDSAKAYLVDKYVNARKLIKPGVKYQFYTNAGVIDDRFEIVFSPITEVDDFEPSINIWTQNRQIHLLNLDNQTYEIEIYDYSGKFIYSGQLSESEKVINVNSSGVYLIKIYDKNDISIRKIVVI